MEIRIYRKESVYERPKLNKDEVEAIRKRIALFARQERPSLLEHFIPTGKVSDFYRQSELPGSVIDNRPLRITEHSGDGWTVPSDSLGRKGEASPSQAQSILLWIKQHIVGNGLANDGEVAVICENC